MLTRLANKDSWRLAKEPSPQGPSRDAIPIDRRWKAEIGFDARTLEVIY